MLDFNKLMQEHHLERERILGRLVEMCKHLEPQLRDLNAQNSADRLAALLGELDVLERRLQDAVSTDPRGFAEALIRGLSREK